MYDDEPHKREWSVKFNRPNRFYLWFRVWRYHEPDGTARGLCFSVGLGFVVVYLGYGRR